MARDVSTEPRKPGWYWVKLHKTGSWVAAAICGQPESGNWACHGEHFSEREFHLIGPRIPTPDEVGLKP